MNIEHLKDNGTDIAVISSDEKLIVDVQSALDLVMTVKYETGTTEIVITSKPLKDFIYESNHGNDFFFLTKEEAIQELKETQ